MVWHSGTLPKMRTIPALRIFEKLCIISDLRCFVQRGKRHGRKEKPQDAAMFINLFFEHRHFHAMISERSKKDKKGFCPSATANDASTAIPPLVSGVGEVSSSVGR